MKIKSQLITQASGSIGGLTASRNKGGMYFRARAIPTNPNTVYQQAIRSLVAQLTSAWTNVLNDAQRLLWTWYAEQVPLIDTLGEPRNIPPLSHYVRSNVPRLQAGLARVDDGPTVYNLGEYTAPAISDVDSGDSNSDVTFDNGDDWAGEVGSSMLILFSRGMNPSINYFKGPFRYAGKINGALTPPTSPATITLPFAVETGQKVFMQARVSRADGRLSTATVLSKIATA